MEEKKNNLYEAMYIVSARLSDEARQRTLDKIQMSITEIGGEVLKIHDWGRRRLAYEIAGHREGYYFIIYFTIASSKISELQRDYKLNEDLIRYILLRAQEAKEKIEFKSFVEQ